MTTLTRTFIVGSIAADTGNGRVFYNLVPLPEDRDRDTLTIWGGESITLRVSRDDTRVLPLPGATVRVTLTIEETPE